MGKFYNSLYNIGKKYVNFIDQWSKEKDYFSK